MCKLGVPRQRAASAQPLVLYVASQNVLRSLEQHGKRHARDVALLRSGHLVAERKLQERLETHLRELLPHPHVNLCLCQDKTVYLIILLTALSTVIYTEFRESILPHSTHEEFDGSYCWWSATDRPFANGYNVIPSLAPLPHSPKKVFEMHESRSEVILGQCSILPVNEADCEWIEPLLSIAMTWPTKSLGMKLANGKISVLMSWTT